MSNDRSPDTPVAADPASWADGIGGDGRDLPQSRGFLGRILGAFGGGDAEPETPDAGDKNASQPASGVPGMVNLRRMRVDDVAKAKAEIVAKLEDLSAQLANAPEAVDQSLIDDIKGLAQSLDDVVPDAPVTDAEEPAAE